MLTIYLPTNFCLYSLPLNPCHSFLLDPLPEKGAVLPEDDFDEETEHFDKVLAGNPPGPAFTSTPAPETITKYATVENLPSHTEAFMQVPEIKALEEGDRLRAWIEETRALGLAHFDLVNRYVLTCIL
jgi:hypothetical protein